MSGNPKKKNQGGKQPAKNSQQQQKNAQPGGPSRRRRRRNQNKGGGNAMQVQGRNGGAIKAVDNPVYQKALGDRATIMVDVSLDVTSVQTFFIPLMSVAMSLGFVNSPVQQIYDAYFARLTDFINLLKGQIPVVPARLQYENVICATYLPKDVPFKTGTVATSWKGTDSISIPNTITVRSYNYYLYIPGGPSSGVWKTQLPPAIPSIEDAVPILAKAYNYLSSNSIPHLVYTTMVDLEPDYLKDISGFGANSGYYGEGSSLAGCPVKSAEWETPVKAPLLSCLSPFSAGDERVAKHLKMTGGDSTYVGGVALLPNYTLDLYKTKVNPCFCYLDLDEVVLWLQGWYITLLSQAQKNSSVTDATGFPFAYFQQFPYTAQQFRIAVRQAILGIFIQSQAAGQTSTYTTDARGFEPFRVGSNCYSQNKYQMIMPLLLVENIRMLLPRYLMQDSKIKRNHNQQIYLPIWGIYKGVDRDPINLTGQFWNGEGLAFATMFSSDIDVTDPSIIDGKNPSGLACDLNTKIVDEILLDWNDRVNALQLFSTTTAYLGGSARASFLIYTRFCHYNPEDFEVPMSSLSRLEKKYLQPNHIRTKKLPRTVSSSKKGTVEFTEQDFYIPPSATLFTQFTDSYSSITTLTETAKQALNYFITPTIAIDDNIPPTVRQVRTANMQSHILEFPKRDPFEFSVDSRASKILELAGRCAPGVGNAGKADELVAVLQAMSDENKGGFFGSLAGFLFPEVAPITNMLPF